ncbi:hypothetical protein LLG46_10975 [bacterium]|nr:hypothetical protein [bacterium]
MFAILLCGVALFLIARIGIHIVRKTNPAEGMQQSYFRKWKNTALTAFGCAEWSAYVILLWGFVVRRVSSAIMSAEPGHVVDAREAAQWAAGNTVAMVIIGLLITAALVYGIMAAVLRKKLYAVPADADAAGD